VGFGTVIGQLRGGGGKTQQKEQDRRMDSCRGALRSLTQTAGAAKLKRRKEGVHVSRQPIALTCAKKGMGETKGWKEGETKQRSL